MRSGIGNAGKVPITAAATKKAVERMHHQLFPDESRA
jgi:hypothetical protein